MCQEAGIGYLDGAGNCHIQGEGLFIHVEGLPLWITNFLGDRGVVGLLCDILVEGRLVIATKQPHPWRRARRRRRSVCNRGHHSGM
jgi:hypothetical protein